MGGKTKIGGTAYELTPGKVKIGGTAHVIEYGKTKIGGTAYEISFSAVPSEYKEVAYIKSSSTDNYVALPIKTQNNITAHYWCYPSLTDSSGYSCHWGYYSSTTARNQRCYLYKSNGRFYAYQDGKNVYSAVTTADGQPYEVTVNFRDTNPRISFNFNGTENSFTGTATLTAGYAMSLWSPAGSASTYRSNGGFGRFTITNTSGDVLLDLYPCYRRSDNEPGFWDAASETFLTNSGSGTLEAVS